MDYELAKQLKEAGFPLIGIGEPSVYQHREIIMIDDMAYFSPTLEELIEACGNEIFKLTKHGNIWQTNFVDGMAGETAGRTPTEAVAQLWLKLNNN